ncbi:hypothetical protein Pcinc_018126 [Petrolisthes cinctipes]|uniref:Uncharacterized protein n=1 Tax=Petrolisthes cinctipes TaxID=88211 RepID=A0AAE1FSS4_PETCI|nr:hypothetical protein Pcinc_018126 [Petrolisthes cinctipes]
MNYNQCKCPEDWFGVVKASTTLDLFLLPSGGHLYNLSNHNIESLEEGVYLLSRIAVLLRSFLQEDVCTVSC